jgi:hypothetical protein
LGCAVMEAFPKEADYVLQNILPRARPFAAGTGTVVHWPSSRIYCAIHNPRGAGLRPDQAPGGRGYAAPPDLPAGAVARHCALLGLLHKKSLGGAGLRPDPPPVSGGYVPAVTLKAVAHCRLLLGCAPGSIALLGRHREWRSEGR